MNAAGTRWRKSEDRPLAVLGDQRLAKYRPVVREIFPGQNSAMFGHPLANLIGNWPSIKKVDTIASDPAQ
jgi:hypothetical protein